MCCSIYMLSDMSTPFSPKPLRFSLTLWSAWWRALAPLRPACSRTATFLWLAALLAALCIRPDLAGVTSLLRALGLRRCCYYSLLHFFHSDALNLETLTRLWCQGLWRLLPRHIVRVGSRPVVLVDGLKRPKEGLQMPGVKSLHQESGCNSKAEFIMGHSLQAVALLVRGAATTLAMPVAARIHEGVVWSNRDQRSLLDKLGALLLALPWPEAVTVVADAYYAAGKFARLLQFGHHLVTRVRSNAIAFFPVAPAQSKRRGRPKKYGRKTHLRDWFRLKARFIWGIHPSRGRLILLCTDLAMSPLDIIRLYGWRFKIEVGFKQAIHTLGAYAYHFWMQAMTPLRRGGGNQHLHRKSESYRQGVRRKLAAYERHRQLGLIAQGLMVYLAVRLRCVCWHCANHYLRTVKLYRSPSEAVVRHALRNTWSNFLAFSPLA